MNKVKLTKLDRKKICADADALLEKARSELKAYRNSISISPTQVYRAADKKVPNLTHASV
jgi:hypothetical protein